MRERLTKWGVGALILLLCAAAGVVGQVNYHPAIGSTVLAGGSTVQANIGGVLYATTAAASNSGTSATLLMSYNLPANTLDAAGRCIRVSAWGVTAANGNNKEAYIQFASTVLGSTAYSGWNNQGWRIETLVCKVSSNLQTALARSDMAAAANGAITDRQLAVSAASGTLTMTDTAAITIAVYGRSGTASDDVIASAMIVEMLN